MGKIVLVHDFCIPFKEMITFGFGKHDKTSGGLEFIHQFPDAGITLLKILHSDRFVRELFYTEHPSAAIDELCDLFHGLYSGSAHFNHEQHSVFLWTVAQFAVLDARACKYVLRHIVCSSSVLMDGLPNQRGIWHVELDRERFRLHAHCRPHVGICREYGYVGIHVGIAHQRTQTGPVLIQQVPVRPPCVLLVVVAAILHPSGEGGLFGGVVESVPHRVGDAGNAAHVRTNLKILQRGGEDVVGVCHLLAADKALACEMRSGRDVLVYHGVGASAAVVFISHLLAYHMAQPVGGPGFSFGDVKLHGRLQGEETAAVGLGSGLYPVLCCPLCVNLEETFIQEFRLREFEVVTCPVHLVLELLALGAAVIEVFNFSETANLEHGERQPGEDVITSAGFEFFSKIPCPIRAFEFHAVHKKGAEVILQGA